MTRGMDNDPIWRLRGELPTAELDRLERIWSALEPPPPSPVPPGFAGRVMARVRSEPEPGALSWAAAPGWVRASAAAALLAGALLGVGVGRSWPAAEPAATAEDAVAAAPAAVQDDDLSLAGGYWEAMDDASSPSVETEVPR